MARLTAPGAQRPPRGLPSAGATGMTRRNTGADTTGTTRRTTMSEQKRTTIEEARRVGDTIGVNWNRFAIEQFRAGMDVEFEHGAHDPQTDVTHDDPILTGKIALAHM